jgi:regulator of protease activity HflC (stomatin/prohibitin superfamily)
MLYIVLAAAALLALVVCVLLAAGAKSSRDDASARGFVTGAIIWAIVLIGVTVAFAATTVSPRAVGIETAFGRYQSTLPAGFHWTAPWSSVEEFPTQVQFLDLNKSEDATAGPAGVSYKGGGKGEVDTTIRWRIDEKNAEALWRKYRSFENVRDQLVLSAARDSLGVVVGAYAPNDARAGENRRTITSGVVDDLAKVLGDDGIRIDSVSVTDVRLDENTQRSIEAIIKANADVERAKAERERARIDNETANLRAKSAALSAGALQRYCLEVTNSWDQGKNGPLPATWNCLGGATPPVVVGR